MLEIIKKNYLLLISTFIILYFIFNLLDGERDLFSYIKKKEILKNLQKTEKDYVDKIENLEFKNCWVNFAASLSVCFDGCQKI